MGRRGGAPLRRNLHGNGKWPPVRRKQKWGSQNDREGVERSGRTPKVPYLLLPRKAMSRTSGKLSTDDKRLSYPSSRPGFHSLKWKPEQFHRRNMALKLEERKNTTVREGIIFHIFINLERWRLIMSLYSLEIEKPWKTFQQRCLSK